MTRVLPTLEAVQAAATFLEAYKLPPREKAAAVATRLRAVELALTLGNCHARKVETAPSSSNQLESSP